MKLLSNEDLKELLYEIFSSESLAPHKIEVLRFDESYDSIEVSYVALDYDGHELNKRDFKIRDTFQRGLSVSHGLTFNPKGVLADIIQNIIVGEIAKELLILNKED
jgi:hypothetical protein